MITYPCWDLSQAVLVKSPPVDLTHFLQTNFTDTYDCPNSSEAIPKNMRKLYHIDPQEMNYNYHKTKYNTFMCIFTDN